MKKTRLYLLLAFAFVFFGGLLPNQVLAADVTFTCSTTNPSECSSTRNGWNVNTIDHICRTNCNVNYTSHTGTVTIVMQCDANSPSSFTGRLTVNGVSTPVHTQTCAPANPPASISAACAVPSGPVNISWPAVTGATHYALRVDYPSDPAPHLVQNDTVAGTSYNTFVPDSGTSYTTWVHACNAAGCSAGVATSNFSCIQQPSGTITTLTPCTITAGNNSCSGSVSWNTSYVTNPLIRKGASTLYSTASGTSEPVILNYGTNLVTLNDGANELDTETVTANCDATAPHWNTSYCQVNPVPPPAAITITAAEDLVRSGNSTTLDINVSAGYPVSCTIEGGTTPNTITSSQTVTTKALTSAQIFTVTCTPNPAILGVSPATAEARVEVVPTIQEI